jgi:transcription antitermination factor NusG
MINTEPAVPYWAVAQINRAPLVIKLLKIEGYECYAPKIKIGRKQQAALFPGYLMVRIRVGWYPVRWCPGVIRLLMNGERPARLDDRIVNEIMSREVKGFVKLPKDPNALSKGQQVRIKTGVFAGQFAVYDGMTGNERERVLLEWMGQSVTVNLPLGSVEALQPVL